jgi:hypothetical protein
MSLMSITRFLDAHRATVDSMLIVAAVFAPVASQLPHLGFYGDDWSFLASMGLAENQSLSGLFAALRGQDNAARPIQRLTLAALYELFGLAPLGYHIFSTLVIGLGSLLFYLCLRLLREPDLFAFSIPLVYSLLPHYSTDRLWIAALQANVSACLYFLSSYADLRALASFRRFWGWKALSLASLLASGLAYEVFLPLFIVSSVFLFVRHRMSGQHPSVTQTLQRRLVVILGTNVLTVVMIVLVKFKTMSSGIDFAAATYGWVAGHILQGFRVGYVDHFLKIPHTLSLIVSHYASWSALVTAGLLGAVLFAWLLRNARKTESFTATTRSRLLTYAGLGIIVCGAGFLILPPHPTMTGINDRAANAASVGVAISVVGTIGWIVLSAKRRWWPPLFAAGIGLICVSGFLTVNTVASFWVNSYTRQRQVLAAIHARFPTMAAGTTLILDGVCQYDGPAIVFNSYWDLAGALMVLYGHSDIRADVVNSTPTISENGLTIAGPYRALNLYPFHQTIVYHFGRREARNLDNADAAYAYFADTGQSTENECPQGQYGFGVPIFGSFRSSVVRLLNLARQALLN